MISNDSRSVIQQVLKDIEVILFGTRRKLSKSQHVWVIVS